jgi:hypothetical protein
MTTEEARPFEDSLCWRCLKHREVRAARSTFVMCTALPVKYPRQPVLTCVAFDSGGAGPLRSRT